MRTIFAVLAGALALVAGAGLAQTGKEPPRRSRLAA
jgi:hypothetical protein